MGKQKVTFVITTDFVQVVAGGYFMAKLEFFKMGMFSTRVIYCDISTFTFFTQNNCHSYIIFIFAPHDGTVIIFLDDYVVREEN
jgi:hypothetical protein